jgi:hypothetical protein
VVSRWPVWKAMMSGGFAMNCTPKYTLAASPASLLTTDELRTELERIGNDVMVDLALTESDNAKAD